MCLALQVHPAFNAIAVVEDIFMHDFFNSQHGQNFKTELHVATQLYTIILDTLAFCNLTEKAICRWDLETMLEENLNCRGDDLDTFIKATFSEGQEYTSTHEIELLRTSTQGAIFQNHYQRYIQQLARESA